MDPTNRIKSDPSTDMGTTTKNENAGTGRENFVSKLYQMLDSPNFKGIVSWNETDEGPSFIILDTAKFQEHILVNEFNHANFSSFVRQLNKYDFHKVKFRDQHSRVWEFRHPFFRPENRDKANLIKRKQQSANRRGKRNDNSYTQANEAVKAAEMAAKDAEDNMKGQYNGLESRLHRLEQNYSEILSALRLQQNLVERLCNEINLPDSDMEREGHVQQLQQSIQEQKNSLQPPPPFTVPGTQLQQSGQPVAPMQMQQMQPQFYQQQQQQNFSSPSVSPAMGGTPSGDTSFAVDLTALVAIDDTKVRDILIKILIKFGIRVDSVDNGVEVVRRVETQTYDYILIDSILKLLDGLSAVILIRQMSVFTPILLLSDAISSEEELESLQRGVSAVLFRPFSQTDLLNALRRFSPR